jgi:hypothetical protein
MGVLSKLDILKPLYKCGGGIYVSQVFSGAKVRITADKAGSPQIKLFDDIVTTDHGGAWLYISQPLVESSLVTAVQEFNGDVSPPETVTVSPIPNSQEYLETPVVIPPLYACGTIIPFDRIVNGATTDVFVTGVKKATLPLPGPRVNLWWSPLVKGDEISARQRLCKTQSGLSTKVLVQSYPKKSLPKPVITPPVYNCSTAIRVTKLVTGALVTVYVDGLYPPLCHCAGNGGERNYSHRAAETRCGDHRGSTVLQDRQPKSNQRDSSQSCQTSGPGYHRSCTGLCHCRWDSFR